MATLDELCNQKRLVKLGGGLDYHEQPERRLYAFPHVIDWLDAVLPTVVSELGDGSQTPEEQIDDLLYMFVSGADMSFYERSHSMTPSEHGVWELKSPDLRLFGWFRRKGTFVITRIDTAFRCKQHGLYVGYRSDAVRLRDGMNLDEPKFVTGNYDDVL